MAQQSFRALLNAAVFPFVSMLAGRTVLQPKLDSSVRTPQNFYGSAESMEMNTPQCLYCENVMPTVEGVQSVGYRQQIRPLVGAIDFDQAITLRDFDENNFLFVPARGKNYIWNAVTGDWDSVNPIVGWNGKLVTRAYVNGRTFICYEGIGIYEYDHTAGTFAHQAITGLTDAEVRGIGSSSNYLIAFTALEVCWSSLVNPLDFVPSLTTGAGRSIPQDVKARITAVLGISGGFIVYTAKNAIAAIYTNNTRAPFTFKEIANAGGIQTYEQVTSEQTSGAQYAWTTGGLQKITVQSAEPVSGGANDFIAGKMWDEWNPATKTLAVQYSQASEFPVKMSFISSRYLIMSYSVSNDNTLFEWALVLDTVLKRWGKLKISHADCFSYPYPNVSNATGVTYADLANTTYDDLSQTTYNDLLTGVISDPPSKLTIAFLKPNGEVHLAEMDYEKTEADPAVAIFGKFQLVRGVMVSLQEAYFDGLYGSTADLPHTMTVTALAEPPNNKPTIIKELTLLSSTGKNARYAKRVSGESFDIAVEGTFALSTYQFDIEGNVGSR
jgi:hypothetical protein